MADTSRYHSQEQACSKYFKSNDVSGVYVIDITGKDAREVVGLLKSIVNKSKLRDYDDTTVFEFKIKPPNLRSASRFFRLCPNPTDHQPGNGTISYIETWYDTEKKEQCTFEAKHSYKNLNDLLTKEYTRQGEEKTHLFARDIQKVFKNNEEIYNVPLATAAAYMVLLFEIGRRLVITSSSEYDKLPIGSAIERLVKLLEAKKCSFKDVFLKKGTFHCFSDYPGDRKDAIKRINKEYEGDKGGDSEDEINLITKQMDEIYQRKP